MADRSGARRSDSTTLVLAGLALLVVVAVALWFGDRDDTEAPSAPLAGDGGERTASTSDDTPVEDAGERVQVQGDGEPIVDEGAITLDAPEVLVSTARVRLHGTAVRVDASGSEHAGDDGSVRVAWRDDTGLQRREVPVEGGRWSIEGIAESTLLRVLALELAGKKLVVEPEEVVIDDRFVALRGLELGELLVYVVSDVDGRELTDVRIHPTAYYIPSGGYEHPGREPQEPAVARGDSPLRLASASSGRHGRRSYWVHAPGFAWGKLDVQHDAGSDASGATPERVVRLVPAASLEVTLVGNEDWLQPELRLWPEGAPDNAAYAYSITEVGDAEVVLVEGVSPGTWVASIERGWAHDRVSFGSATVDLAAGERARLTIPLVLPERPAKPLVRGRLILPHGWKREGVAVVFEAQNAASVWADGEIDVTLEAMEARGAGEYAFEVTLPSPGDYEVLVEPHRVRSLEHVPDAGLEDLVLEVPPPADVEVVVRDETTGDELRVDSLHWSPPRVEGIVGTPLYPAARDPESGRVRFRAPAGQVSLSGSGMELRLVGETNFDLVPGPQRVEVEAQRQFGVRFRFMDEGAEIPWSWNWRLGAVRVAAEGQGQDVARSIGMLWFREEGQYSLSSRGEIPGYLPIRDFVFAVQAPREGEAPEPVVVPLERQP